MLTLPIPPYDIELPGKPAAYGSMDFRHVYIMHDLIMSWPFKHALELGSLHGVSATAYIEAINRGADMQVTFCDLEITRTLRDYLGTCERPDRISTLQMPSTDALSLDADFDFIFVDADHDLEPVKAEVEHLIRREPLCIMAHDTNATAAGYRLCEGAKYLKQTFQTMPHKYGWLEDCKKREGEATERGLFFATTSNELYQIATDIFARWCSE